MIKLFMVTDIHGSNVCYRKFLNALPIYGVDLAVLMGDLTGKVLVPLVDKGGDQWECTLMGQYREINGQEELADIKKTIENAGLLLGPPDARGVRRHAQRPGQDRRPVQEPRVRSASRSGSTSPTSASRASRTRCTWRRATTTGS